MVTEKTDKLTTLTPTQTHEQSVQTRYSRLALGLSLHLHFFMRSSEIPRRFRKRDELAFAQNLTLRFKWIRAKHYVWYYGISYVTADKEIVFACVGWAG